MLPRPSSRARARLRGEARPAPAWPLSGRRVGEAGELAPEQQAAIKRTRRLKDQGLALRTIADRMTAAGIQISHVGVKKVLAAVDRAPSA